MQIEMIPLDDIEVPVAPPPDKTLVRSIAIYGNIVPVSLVVAPDSESMYRVVYGRRRVLAAKLAGKTGVYAMVAETADKLQEVEQALMENLHRSENPACEAKCIGVMLEHMSMEEIVSNTGLSKSTISMRKKLLTLVPELFVKVEDGSCPSRAAYIACDLNALDQFELAKLDRITIKQVQELRKKRNLEGLALETIEVPDEVESAQPEAAAQAQVQPSRSSVVEYLRKMTLAVSGNQRGMLSAAANLLEKMGEEE